MKFRLEYFGLAAVGAATLCLSSVACDSLEPAAPQADGGTVTPATDGGANGQLTQADGIVPAGAYLGEKKDTKLGGEITTWALTDPATNKVKEIVVALPLALVRTVKGADQRVVVAIPQIAINQTVIHSLSVNYYTSGHIPPGVYDTPHWELHPSIITEAEVQQIDCKPENDVPAFNPVAMPDDFLLPPPSINPCVPQMGTHMGWAKAPEFQGERFRVGAHGATYWKGKYLSVEPKAANEYMLRREGGVFPTANFKSLGLAAPSLFPMNVKFEYNEPFDTYLFRFIDFVEKQ